MTEYDSQFYKLSFSIKLKFYATIKIGSTIKEIHKFAVLLIL